MQLLTDLLPSRLSDDVLLGCSTVEKSISLDFLTSDEHRRYIGFDSTTRRREFLSTRKLICNLADQPAINSSHFQVKKDAQGQPYGQVDDRRYFLSIAHTKNHVLCGISPRIPLGIDLEPVDRSAPEKLRLRIMNTQENKRLAELKTMRIWTIKEALVKLQGRGMRTNLNEWMIAPAGENLFTATYRNVHKARIISFKHKKNWVALAWYN